VKTTSLALPAVAIAVFAVAIFAATTGAQAPQIAPQAPPPADQPVPSASPSPAPQGTALDGRPMRNYPPPTNLQVLPKNLTGREVREIMETWAGSLGVHCNFCHVADPKNLSPNGRPHLKFPDDSKPDKKIARLMYTMTQQINRDTISKAMDLDPDGMGSPVTCGTCHRGHQMPEDFVVPREEHQEGPGAEPGAPPAAGATPPSRDRSGPEDLHRD
jgi:hypothetical protein